MNLSTEQIALAIASNRATLNGDYGLANALALLLRKELNLRSKV